MKLIIDNLKEEIVNWRRYLHQYPELAWNEFNTSKFISEELIKLNYKIVKNSIKPTVFASLKNKPESPTILLRADMDALAINEKNEVPYRSKNIGKMHACGHDGHMAILLGLAKAISIRKNKFKGNIIFCFQPAEEGGAGGEKIVNSGLLEQWKVREVYAYHLYSGLKIGTFACPDMEFLASADEFEITITGKGTHGALPHTGKDPILAASNLIVSLQQIVSRNIDPLDKSVVTVGYFSSGESHNVIPEKAKIKGTIRAFNVKVRDLIVKRMKHICSGISSIHNVKVDLSFYSYYPPTINHKENAEYFRNAAIKVLNKKKVLSQYLLPVAEDFSFYLKKYPGAMALLGAGNKDIKHSHHSPYFNIDEKALIYGVKILWQLIKSRFQY